MNKNKFIRNTKFTPKQLSEQTSPFNPHPRPIINEYSSSITYQNTHSPKQDSSLSKPSHKQRPQSKSKLHPHHERTKSATKATTASYMAHPSQMDQLLTDPLYIQIKSLWDELGVTLSYRNIFNNVSLQLDQMYREGYFTYEKKQLTYLADMINKVNKDIDSREKTIKLLETCAKYIQYDSNDNISQDKLISNIIGMLNDLRAISLNIVNSYIAIRKEIGYDVLMCKHKLDNIANFDKDYLLHMKNDTDFLYKTSLNKFFTFASKSDPFLTTIAVNLNDTSSKYPLVIEDTLIETIKNCQYLMIQEMIYNECNKSNKSNSYNTIHKADSSQSIKSIKANNSHNNMLSSSPNQNKRMNTQNSKKNIHNNFDIAKLYNDYKKEVFPEGVAKSKKEYAMKQQVRTNNKSPEYTKIKKKQYYINGNSLNLGYTEYTTLYTHQNKTPKKGKQVTATYKKDKNKDRNVMISYNNNMNNVISRECGDDNDNNMQGLDGLIVQHHNNHNGHNHNNSYNNNVITISQTEQSMTSSKYQKENDDNNHSNKHQIQQKNSFSRQDAHNTCMSNNNINNNNNVHNNNNIEINLYSKDSIHDKEPEDKPQPHPSSSSSSLYTFDQFKGNFHIINNQYINLYPSIPVDQKTSFNLKPDLTYYLKGIYPKIYTITSSNTLYGIITVCYDPEYQSAHKLNITSIAIKTSSHLGEVLHQFISYIDNAIDYDEIDIEFYYGVDSEGNFYMHKDLETLLKTEAKFKWINMENDGETRKIRYKYRNTRTNQNAILFMNESSLFSSNAYNVIKLSTCSYISLTPANDNEKQYTLIKETNDFDLLCLISEMISNKQNYTINIDNNDPNYEYSSYIIDIMSNLNIDKLRSLTKEFVFNCVGQPCNVVDFVNKNLPTVCNDVSNDMQSRNNILATTLKQVQTSFSKVIKTQIDNYSYNVIETVVDVLEITNTENKVVDRFYLIHTTNDNVSLLLYEFDNSSNASFKSMLKSNTGNDGGRSGNDMLLINVTETFKQIYLDIDQRPVYTMKKIYIPSFKIQNKHVINNPSLFSCVNFEKGNDLLEVTALSLIEYFNFSVDDGNINGLNDMICDFTTTTTTTNTGVNGDNSDNDSIIIKNDFAIAFIHPDLLADLKLPTFSAFIVNKSNWMMLN